MQQEQKLTRKVSITEKLSKFILYIRFVLWVILAVLFGGLLFYFIYTEITGRIREDSTVLVEKAEKLQSEWIKQEAGEQKQKLEEKLVADLDSIIKAYPNQYAGQRALFIRGNMYMNRKEWQQAAESFMTLKKSFPRSYLATEALFKTGVCQEELNEPEKAIASYTELTEKFKSSPRIPHAYFSIARLNEQKESYEEAVRIYNLLKLDYSYSYWTNLGINRIIELKSEGKISEQQ